MDQRTGAAGRSDARARAEGLARRIKLFLLACYDQGIRQVLLYGSHARGTAQPGSDVDLLVVTTDDVDARAVRRSLEEVLLDILLEEGELVSVIVVPERLYRSYRSPLLVNVRREGVPV